jgi:hypothetical protein
MHFRAELTHGHARTVAKLKAVVFAAARQGSLRACCYLLEHGRLARAREWRSRDAIDG